jgi:hypothetical protein
MGNASRSETPVLFQRDGGEKRGQTDQKEYASYRPGSQAGFAGGLSAYASFLHPTAVPGMEPPLEALCVAPFGTKEGMLDSGFAPG